MTSPLVSDFDSVSVTSGAMKTRPAYPLSNGIPTRNRYGMTPQMASVYNMLVRKYAHDKPFHIAFHHDANMHRQVDQLIDRGWIDRRALGCFVFVHPVMKFKERG